MYIHDRHVHVGAYTMNNVDDSIVPWRTPDFELLLDQINILRLEFKYFAKY